MILASSSSLSFASPASEPAASASRLQLLSVTPGIFLSRSTAGAFSLRDSATETERAPPAAPPPPSSASEASSLPTAAATSASPYAEFRFVYLFWAP